jgi:hypothetical protein
MEALVTGTAIEMAGTKSVAPDTEIAITDTRSVAPDPEIVGMRSMNAIICAAIPTFAELSGAAKSTLAWHTI